MYTNNDNENSRPVTPTQEDCCHSACEPCIFDIHKKLLEEYERRKKQNIKLENKHNVLCTFAYKNFVVIDKIQASECYILLSLKYKGTELSIMSTIINIKYSIYQIFNWKYFIVPNIQDDYSLHGINIKSGRLDQKSVLEVLQDTVPDSTLILICGTREFNSSVEQWVKSMNYCHAYIFQ
ncbi:uncharacterized protein LOC113464146 [Ceratina calcarata]|uniref:Uncharacterized protein LOC113464146 n=1 Tax=Ceratina calcarata TaxID=156304 RepID=A0AAJ7RZF1_9HYME|nr:uncharacterized protein LOC113464146 [Ceratina calcarata]